MVRKVPKFHGASANGFWYRSEKPQGGRFAPPPPVIGLNSEAFDLLRNGDCHLSVYSRNRVFNTITSDLALCVFGE